MQFLDFAVYKIVSVSCFCGCGDFFGEQDCAAEKKKTSQVSDKIYEIFVVFW